MKNLTPATLLLEKALQLDGEKIIQDLQAIITQYTSGQSTLTNDQYTTICVLLDCLTEKKSPD